MLKNFRKSLPKPIKTILRLFKYKAEWKKQYREINIKNQQKKYIKTIDINASNLIVFLVPGAEYVSGKDSISGGVISIFSIFSETLKLKKLHDSEIIMATLPNEHLIYKYENFENDVSILSFGLLLKNFKNLKNLIVHIPEMSVSSFLRILSCKEVDWLINIEYSQLNILNQNIELMPTKSAVNSSLNYFSNTTITTAHQQYCNEYFRDYYNVPLHRLSVWISPEKYIFRNYHEKENLLVYSPDYHPLKEKIISKLSKLDGVKLTMIEGLTYSEYKKLISSAKWTLTFGEGLDGYFIESVFSGATSFAVYNTDFFTKDFEGLKTVYSSFEDLYEKICFDIENLDEKSAYSDYQQKQYRICEQLYNSETYRDNIAKFYEKDYTFK